MKRASLSWISIATAVAIAIALVAWRHGGSADRLVIVRFAPLEAAFDLADVTFDPPTAVRSARLGAKGSLTVLLGAASRVNVRIPRMCPLAVDPSASVERIAKPWIDLGGDRAQIGFDAPFEIRAVPGCPEAKRGKITWRQLEGPTELGLEVDEEGFRLRARTGPFEGADTQAHGIVPVSPRTQGRYVLEATWRGEEGPPIRSLMTVTSIARSTGLPAIAVGQAVMLAGGGWHVQQMPPRGTSRVDEGSGFQFFAPDAPGRWLLADDAGRTLPVRASRYDDTPLDCGRSECHRTETDATVPTPMSEALERQLRPDGQAHDVSCMLDCHVVGERGLQDGGFLDVAASLGWRWGPTTRWEELPRALRRLGGVRCTSCHGPGAIPEREARDLILRSAVCATCHDAPPSYTHVSEWQRSRMSRSDVTPETRDNPRCARCHTTYGFLDAAGIRKRDLATPGQDAVGIACAACHAAHGAHRGDKLVRTLAVSEVLGGQATSDRYPAITPCLECHSPASDDALPSASAAALWLGRVSVPGRGPLMGQAAHAAIAGGCIGCHGKRTNGSSALDHTLAVNPAVCAGCHAGGAPGERPDAEGRRVRERAETLIQKLTARGALRTSAATSVPLHAANTAATARGALDRALYEVILVLEDPAAGIHNAPFARSLLHDAEEALR